ncbi:hypothetical protein [Sorangium sp. So ce124]|uniref:hypothetical protein n=1 Tax=Sorangium sp. So ce124 TaxID=3133280 RepID=UPI003F5ED8B1
MTHDASDEPDDLEPPGNADPLLEACLADALGPYLGALSPEEIEDYRRLLTIFIKTHPVAAPLYDRLRARPPVPSESGEVARDASSQRAGGPAAGEAAARRDGTFGGRR